MITAVATAAASEQVAQERRRRKVQSTGEDDGAQGEPSPSSSESALCEEEHPQAAVETLDMHIQSSAFAPDTLASLQDSNEDQLKETDRAQRNPDVQQNKLQLLASSAENTVIRPTSPPTLTAKEAPTAAVTANPVARLVDAVLQLTNERFGATLRVQLKLADEVVQGVAEAADESERGDSCTVSQLKTMRLGTQGTSLAHVTGSPRFAAVVEEVFKFDLMENNPNWKTFLTSSTGLKAQMWDTKRQEASGQCARFIYSPQRKWIYVTLSYPDYSPLAYWFGIFIILIILLNTATFCIESVPHYENTSLYNSLTIVDYVCMGIFTAEYALRLLCCPDLPRFIRSFSNLIDVVAILPFYIELCVKGTSNESEAFQTRIVRLLRIFRVLRIVKSMPRLRHLTLVSDTLRDSTEILIMMACLLLVVLVVFGTIVYFVEPETFDSIPQAMYYAQTTLTTTGYGDIYPVTPWGRFVAGAAMLLCMVVVSLPIAVIGGNFSEKWSEYKEFKSAVNRSSRVYPTARALQSELERYEQALDDVMKRLQECEVASEKQLQFVRGEIASARAALLHGRSDAAVGLAPVPPSAELAGGRLFQAAKLMMRRVRNTSSGTMFRAGSYTSLPILTAVASQRGSAADLVVLDTAAAAAAGDGPTCDSGASQCLGAQQDLRSAPAVTNLQSTLQQEEEGKTVDSAETTWTRRAGRFKDVVSHVISKQVREQRAMAITAISEHGSGSGKDAGDAAIDAAGCISSQANPYAVVSEDDTKTALSNGAGTGASLQRLRGTVQPPEPSAGVSRTASKLSEDATTPRLPLPPPPPGPPAPPPPPPPPPPQLPSTALPQQPSVTVISHASVGASSAAVSTSLASNSLSLGAFARHVTNSITTLWTRKSEAVAAGALASAGSVAETVAAPPPPQLPVDPAALEEADGRLEHAALGCIRSRELRIRHEALAAQAQLLRTDDMPAKLEKLDEQYRILRCWQDELGPMAERMWCLRDALDELAWALQEGLPEEEKKYSPANRDARMVADAGLGVMRRKLCAYADITSSGGSVCVATGSAGVAALKAEKVPDTSTRAGSTRASISSLQK